MPTNPADGLDAAYAMVRSRDRIAIIEYVRSNDGAYLEDIETATAIPRASISQHLRALEGLGVIRVDIPEGRRHGRAVRYDIDPERATELTTELTQALLGRGVADA